MDDYFIYILRCEDKSLYTGIAKDYLKRYKKHLEGLGAKYTKSHKPIGIEVVYSALGRSDALKVESFIKSKSKMKKEEIIKDPESLVLEVFEKKNLEITLIKK